MRVTFWTLLFFVTAVPSQASAQSSAPGIDFFSGVNFNFRDINYARQYDLFIDLTPGFKWNLGNHWQIAGQAYVNLINQYEPFVDIVRLNILSISKEFKLGGLYAKASAGAFSSDRYGVDIKAFLPVCSWFAFEAQGGCTGFFSTNGGWGMSPMGRFTGTIGGDIYLARTNTQLRGTIGKYVFGDYGCEAEAMRHFRHSTISLYGRWSNLTNFDGGFRIVAMLPPFHRTHRYVNFRPASNFRLSYTFMYNIYSNRMYFTDPEENERDGWFSRDLMPWGSHTMEPDYIITETISKE